MELRKPKEILKCSENWTRGEIPRCLKISKAYVDIHIYILNWIASNTPVYAIVPKNQ